MVTRHKPLFHCSRWNENALFIHTSSIMNPPTAGREGRVVKCASQKRYCGGYALHISSRCLTSEFFLTRSLRFQNIWDNQNKEHNLHTLPHPHPKRRIRRHWCNLFKSGFGVFWFFFLVFFSETAAFCFLGASCNVSKSLLPACGFGEDELVERLPATRAPASDKHTNFNCSLCEDGVSIKLP